MDQILREFRIIFIIEIPFLYIIVTIHFSRINLPVFENETKLRINVNKPSSSHSYWRMATTKLTYFSCSFHTNVVFSSGVSRGGYTSTEKR